MKVTKENILDFLKEIKPELEDFGIEKLALFGSFATNKQHMYSDIDIAIKIDNTYLQSHDVWDYFRTIERIKNKILEKFHRQSDVFDIDSKSSIKDEIMKEIIYV